MSKEISAIYESGASAEIAVDRLLEGGFSADDVSVLMAESGHGREYVVKQSNKAPEGAVAGAVTGGVAAGAAMALMAAGSIAIPGLGLFAAGPVVAALTGLGAGAAAGGLVGALIGMGVPEHEAKLYAEALRKGHVLLGVNAHDDRTDRAKEILRNSGGRDIRG